MEKLKIEKISNQNFFDLVQTLNYSNKSKVEEFLNTNIKVRENINLINLNFKFDFIRNIQNKINYNFMINSVNNNNSMNNNLNDISMFKIDNTIFESLFKKVSKNKFYQKYDIHFQKKRANFLRAKVLFKLEDQQNSKYIGESEEQEDEESSNILQTLEEISLPNNIRSKIKDIANNKSIKDFFNSKDKDPILNFDKVSEKSMDKSDFSESLKEDLIKISESNPNIMNNREKALFKTTKKTYKLVEKEFLEEKKNQNFSLLKSNNQRKSPLADKITINTQDQKLCSLLKKNNKEKTKIQTKSFLKFIENNLENNPNFYMLLRNFYLFKKIFPDFNFILNKIKDSKNYFYDLKVNRFAFDLYYSNYVDQKLFLEKKQKEKTQFGINKNTTEMKTLLDSHIGIKLYLNRYNKISKRIDCLHSKGINQRRNLIKDLLNKEKIFTEKKKMDQINDCKDYDFNDKKKGISNPFENFEIIKGKSLIFLPKKFNLEGKSIPTKFDIEAKYEKINKIKRNKNNYQKYIFNTAIDKNNFYSNAEILKEESNEVKNLNNNQNEKFKIIQKNFIDFSDLNCLNNIPINDYSSNLNQVNDCSLIDKDSKEKSQMISIYKTQSLNMNENLSLYISSDIKILNSDENPFKIRIESYESPKVINSGNDNSSGNNYCDKTLLIGRNNYHEISYYQENSVNEYNKFFDKTFLQENRFNIEKNCNENQSLKNENDNFSIIGKILKLKYFDRKKLFFNSNTNVYFISIIKIKLLIV